MISMLFKKKENINTIIEKYKTDPEACIKYIDALRASKEYKQEDKRLSDLRTLIDTAIIVGYRSK